MEKNEKKSLWLVENYKQYLCNLYPEFFDLVDEDRSWYESMKYEFNEHSFFRNLTSFTKDLIKQQKYDDVKYLMKIAEILLEYGEKNDENLYNAVATCYIENLVNSAFNSPERVPFESFIPYLGPKAKEYCRYWDDFMGGPKTPGVYD